MAPIEPDLSNSNIRPILLLAVVGVVATSLIYLVAVRVIYRAHLALPPSQATRTRQGVRRKHFLAIAGLALLSGFIALYFRTTILGASYTLWAEQRGEDIPTSSGAFWWWKSSGGGGDSDAGPGLKLGRWLHDTDIQEEIFVLALAEPRRRWWTQQVLTVGGVWTLFVAFEGKRRNIPHLWAFVMLVPLVSLSFAMNSFFLAILQTPVPISEGNLRSSGLVASKTTTKSLKHRRSSSNSSASGQGPLSRFKLPEPMTRIANRAYDMTASYTTKPASWTAHTVVYLVPLLLSLLNTTLLGLAPNTTALATSTNLLAASFFLPLYLPNLLPLAAGDSPPDPQASHRARVLRAIRIAAPLALVLHAATSAVALLSSDPHAHDPRRTLLSLHMEPDRTRTARARIAAQRVLEAPGEHPVVGLWVWDGLLVAVSLAVWAGTRGLDPGALLEAVGWGTKARSHGGEQEHSDEKKETGGAGGKTPRTPTTARGGKKTTGSVRGRKSKGAEAAAAATEKGEEDEDYDDGSYGHDGVNAESAAAVVKARRPGGDGAAWTGDEQRPEDWESAALAWGFSVIGGLGVGAAGVLGADSAVA